MKKILLSLYAANASKEQVWSKDLSFILEGINEIQVELGGQNQECGQIVFLDGAHRDLDQTLASIDRKGRAIFLILEQTSEIPASFLEGKVDDILVTPFRPLEVLSKIHHFEKILMWNEVVDMNASFSEAIHKMSEDLGLAERLQKAKQPKRFQAIKGFRVSNHYLVGLRSGGDYFDLADSSDGSNLSVVLTHSTSYGLSSSILSALMRVTLKLSAEQMGKAGVVTETVKHVYDDLLLTLGDKAQLSLFYGTISRSEQVLRFLNVGTAAVFYAEPGDDFKALPTQGGAMSKNQVFVQLSEHELRLSPHGRLALISHGFVSALGSLEDVGRILSQFRQKDAIDAVNELTFQVKSKFTEAGGMPAQDCTAMIFDVDSRVIKLTKPGRDES
jgi:hypothetical protein